MNTDITPKSLRIEEVRSYNRCLVESGGGTKKGEEFNGREQERGIYSIQKTMSAIK
jgi:hypothetical protein